jgi:hypothetical protein
MNTAELVPFLTQPCSFKVVRSAFVAERLRRQTRNLLGSPRAGSNPAECEHFAQTQRHSCKQLLLVPPFVFFSRNSSQKKQIQQIYYQEM